MEEQAFRELAKTAAGKRRFAKQRSEFQDRKDDLLGKRNRTEKHHQALRTGRGEQIDQSEVSAALGQGMLKIIPIIALSSMIFFPIPGALLLFYAASSIVAVWQQRSVLDDDVEEMEVLADAPARKQSSTNKRADTSVAAVEAEVVERKVAKPVQKRRKGSKVR